MEKKFKGINLENKKIVNVINAAYEEFGCYGVEKASLNNILSSAGVSKGAFYHHFKNKDELQEFLTYFAIKSSYEALDSDEVWKEPDILQRTINSLKLYYEFSEKFPFIFEFLNAMSEVEIGHFIQDNNLNEFAMDKRFYNENCDFSSLRDGVDQEKFIMMAQIIIGEIGKKHFNVVKFHQKECDIEAMVNEMNAYADMLKLGYYK